MKDKCKTLASYKSNGNNIAKNTREKWSEKKCKELNVFIEKQVEKRVKRALKTHRKDTNSSSDSEWKDRGERSAEEAVSIPRTVQKKAIA